MTNFSIYGWVDEDNIKYWTIDIYIIKEKDEHGSEQTIIYLPNTIYFNSFVYAYNTYMP